MDPLHTCIALGPLAMYLLVLGAINLSSRPFLTTGTRDLAALSIAIAGFMVIGPMELFVPVDVLAFWGSWAWGLLLAAYAMFVILVLLMLRPRLVIYNIAPDQLRPVLGEVVARIDSDARWAGESLTMPNLAVQLHLEPTAALKNVQLVAIGPNQSFDGWRRLEIELAAALRSSRGTPNPWGTSQIIFGLTFAALITYRLAADPGGVQQALNEMLRR